MNIKMPEGVILTSNLKPTTVHIFYEKEVPYMDYVGVAETNKGKIKMHFPKLGLDFTVMEIQEDRWNGHLMSQQIYISNDVWVDFEFIDRKMTKEEIEKELGYKVEIIKSE